MELLDVRLGHPEANLSDLWSRYFTVRTPCLFFLAKSIKALNGKYRSTS